MKAPLDCISSNCHERHVCETNAKKSLHANAEGIMLAASVDALLHGEI